MRAQNYVFLTPSRAVGGDQLLSEAAEGKSHVSMEDFAIAMVSEVERPAHSRQRFTVGY